MTILVYSETYPEIMSVFEDEEEAFANAYVTNYRKQGITDVTLEHITSTFEEAQEVLESICG